MHTLFSSVQAKTWFLITSPRVNSLGPDLPKFASPVVWLRLPLCWPLGVCLQRLRWGPGPLLWLGHGDEEMHEPGGEPEHDAVGAEHHHLSCKCAGSPASERSVHGNPAVLNPNPRPVHASGTFLANPVCVSQLIPLWAFARATQDVAIRFRLLWRGMS